MSLDLGEHSDAAVPVAHAALVQGAVGLEPQLKLSVLHQSGRMGHYACVVVMAARLENRLGPHFPGLAIRRPGRAKTPRSQRAVCANRAESGFKQHQIPLLLFVPNHRGCTDTIFVEGTGNGFNQGGGVQLERARLSGR